MELKVKPSHWTNEEFAQIESITSFGGLAKIAVAVAERMAKLGRVVLISGPMTTGGCGSELENRKRFARAIQVATAHARYMVFDQVPFEGKICELRNAMELPSGEYCHDILDVFYFELIHSGHVAELWQLSDWESSHGARREHEMAERARLHIRSYPYSLDQDVAA